MFRSGLFFFFALLVLPSVFSQEECVFRRGSSLSEAEFEGDCSSADVLVFARTASLGVDVVGELPQTVRVEERARVTFDGQFGSRLTNARSLELQNYGRITMENFMNISSPLLEHDSVGETHVEEGAYLWLGGVRVRLNTTGIFRNQGLLYVNGNGFTNLYNGEASEFMNTDTVMVNGGNLVVVRNDGKLENRGHFYVASQQRGIFNNRGTIVNSGYLSIGMNINSALLGNVELRSHDSVVFVWSPTILSVGMLTGSGLLRVGTQGNKMGVEMMLRAQMLHPAAGEALALDFPHYEHIRTNAILDIDLSDKEKGPGHLMVYQGLYVSGMTLRIDHTSIKIARNKPYVIVEAEYIRGTFAAIIGHNDELPEGISVEYSANTITITRN